jgi:hypothetical protein
MLVIVAIEEKPRRRFQIIAAVLTSVFSVTLYKCDSDDLFAFLFVQHKAFC